MSYAEDLYFSQFVWRPTPNGVQRHHAPTETPEDRPDEWPTEAELRGEEL